MSATATSLATVSPGPISPVPVSSPPLTPAPTSPIQTSPALTSPPAVDDAVLKKTDTGVKKPTQKKKKMRNAGFKSSQKAKLALQKMHAFFKAHRDDNDCKGLSHPERQKVLGKLWKASPENPKNTTQI